jgi:hypothetical protein
MTKHVVDTKDDLDRNVIFTHKKWKQKCSDHPELLKGVFIHNVTKTIENPEEVWEDYQDKKHKQCYYKKYSMFSYVKVVIWTEGNPCQVVTAYEIDYIKEENYPELQRLR